MDDNQVFLAIAGLSSLLLLVRSVRNRSRGWIAVSGLLVVVTAAGVMLFRDRAGYVAAGLWAVLVLVPSAGQGLVGRLGNQQRYGAAARLAELVRWFHPADGWWDRPRILRALELGQRGAIDEAAQILVELESSSKPFAREARVHLLRMKSRWEDVLDWIGDNVPDAELRQNQALILLHLRALGETGHLDELVARYVACEAPLAREAGGRNVARLFVFAFSGRREQIESLFRGPLAANSEPLQLFWKTTAELAAASSPEAIAPLRDRLEKLLERPDASIRAAARRRLDHPLGDPSALGAPARATIDRLARERDEEERYGEAPSALRSRAYATFGLMALLVAVFVLEELRGGSTRAETLQELGAVWPEAVLGGEWWRLGAATLLHFGWLHLLMNLAGLYVLGPYVELALGRARFVFTYVAAGVGTMLLVVLLARAGLVDPGALVGASGSIMALVGATGAVLLRGRRVEGSRSATRRLWSVGAIVVVQTAFDLLVPQVSSASHLGGAALGFLLAAAMKHRVTRAR